VTQNRAVECPVEGKAIQPCKLSLVGPWRLVLNESINQVIIPEVAEELLQMAPSPGRGDCNLFGDWLEGKDCNPSLHHRIISFLDT